MHRVVVLVLVLIVAMSDARAQSDDGAPRIFVHYMPWYQAPPVASTWGWHWTMNHFNPNQVDAAGSRSIASHYYPLAGPYDSRDPEILLYHAMLMRVAGIEGVVVDWYGTANFRDYATLHDATAALFEVVRETGLAFIICYEDQTIGHLIDGGRITPGDAIGQAAADLQFVAREWMADDAYARIDGRPILLNFGPQYFQSADAWQQIFDLIDAEPLFFVQNERLEPVAAGAFAWPPMWLSNGGTLSRRQLDNYLDLFYAYGQLEWPSFVGGAFPGFHDIYAEAGVSASYGYLDAAEGETFARTLGRALQAESPIIQVVTWNDFGEGTSIEPTLEFGFRYLEMIQNVMQERADFPFVRDDLPLPLAILELRRRHAQDDHRMAELDTAVAAILSGDPASARAIVDGMTVGREPEDRDRDAGLSLYPNPASGHVAIRVADHGPGVVEIAVFDILGRQVRELAAAPTSGPVEARLNLADLAPGVYYVRATAGDYRTTRSLVVR